MMNVKPSQIGIKLQNNKNLLNNNNSKVPVKNKKLEFINETTQEQKINLTNNKENMNLPKKEISKQIKNENSKK